MYTAVVTNKEKIGAALKMTVSFSDGVNTVQESVIPQDEQGFLFWVKSRLATFNGGDVLEAAYALGATVDVTDVIPEVPTTAETERMKWFSDYTKLQDVQKLISLGVLTGNEAKVVALRNNVKTNFKPEYFDII